LKIKNWFPQASVRGRVRQRAGARTEACGVTHAGVREPIVGEGLSTSLYEAC